MHAKILVGALGAAGCWALLLAGPAAADPDGPAAGPGPAVVVAADSAPAAAPVTEATGAGDVPAAAVTEAAPAPVPHLSSPDNLPPGTTSAADDGPRSHGVTYLRELWHAYQTQEVSGSDVLLLLSQRPMNPGTSARSPMSSGPQAPAADQPAAEPAPVEPVTQPAAPEHE
ncbi:MAG: hypothetical protein U0R77_12330 [Mycolicibacterium insubricum]|nr:hypothetical protein [Mycobacterium sp.]